MCVLFSDEHLFLFEKPKEEKGKEGRDGRDGHWFFLLAFFSALMETGLILIWIWIGLAIRWERGAEDDDARRTTLAVLVRTRNERRNACDAVLLCDEGLSSREISEPEPESGYVPRKAIP